MNTPPAERAADRRLPVASSESAVYHWLDLLRCISAFVVVVMHVRTATFVRFGSLPAPDKTSALAVFYMLTRIGNEAVICFFVLSGYLVGGRALERLQQGRFVPLDFAVDRMVRIMLPLVPALVLSAVVMASAGHPGFAGQWFGNLVGLQGVLVDSLPANLPLWSLSYEIWFYVLVGALGWGWMVPRWRAWAGLLVALVVLAFAQLSTVYLACWWIGALAYLRRPSTPSTLALALSILAIVFAIASIEFQYGSISIGSGLVHELQHWTPRMEIARILLAVGFSFLIRQLVLRPPRAGWAIRLEALGTAGARWSYSLYLAHFPLLYGMTALGLAKADAIGAAAFGRYALVVLACLLFGWLFHWPFERHTAAVRRWFRRSLRHLERRAA